MTAPADFARQETGTRGALEQQRGALDERLARYLAEMLAALRLGKPWYSYDLAKVRRAVEATIAERGVIDLLLGELDAVDAAIAAGAGWSGP